MFPVDAHLRDPDASRRKSPRKSPVPVLPPERLWITLSPEGRRALAELLRRQLAEGRAPSSSEAIEQAIVKMTVTRAQPKV